MSELDSNPTVLKVRKHLVEYLGPPDEVFELSGSPIPGSPMPALNLAYFAPQGPQNPVVFATCGASLYKMADGRRVEGMVLLRREPEQAAFEAVHKMLAQFALFSEANKTPVRLGDVVRAQDMLRGFCEMDAILFMPPVPFVPNFHKAPITADEAVDMVWLLPVYEAEAEYTIKHGPQALMMLFAAQGLDLTEPTREEANTFMEPKDAEEMARRAMEDAKDRAKTQAPVPTAGKPKSSRRDMNKGSFKVEEGNSALKITRRGGVKAPPPPASRPGGAPVQVRAPAPRRARPRAASGAQDAPRAMQPYPRSAAGMPARGPRPGGPPGRPVARPPAKKEEIRVDLKGSGQVQKRPDPPPAPTAPARPAKPRPLTPEEEAAAKKKRVEELKAKAKEAAARAAQRQSQGPGPDEAPAPAPTPAPSPMVSPPVRRDSTSLRAAARRRGGAKQTIRGGLGDDSE
ncbi:MAG: suppressor of fused domain protein [Deltaproteobacteria bacterium]|nr:suppressor of fused domain protein [Deltaproteobacteria bacterium]